QFIRNIHSSSKQVFTEYKVLCESPNLVVVSFDNRPLSVRIQAKLKQLSAQGWQLSGPQWLINSPALASITRQGQPNTIKAALFKQAQFWYLRLNEQQIKLRENEWRLLYKLPNSQQLLQNSPHSIYLSDEYGNTLATGLKNGDEFRINLSGHFKNRRFMSLIYVQSDGSIYPIRVNKALSHHREIPQAPSIFSAELEQNSNGSIDDYIVVISQHPIKPPSSNKNIAAWLKIAEQEISLGLRVLVRQ
ncbi:MAG: hypothetical protein RPR91_05765, partial [Colwellia sp.]